MAALPLFLAACRVHSPQDDVSRYKHSSDLSEQVLRLSDAVALVKFTKLQGDDLGEVKFSFVQAHWGGEPETPSSSGYLVDAWLVNGARRVAIIAPGERAVVDTGSSAPQDARYALVDLKAGKVFKGETVDELQRNANFTPDADLNWLPISIYFDKMLLSYLSSTSR